MAACGDITTMTLHQQCEIASATPGYGDIITRVDGGWIYQKYVIVPGLLKQVRKAEFVSEVDPPNMYVVSNVFDLALDAELLLGLTLTPGYDWNVLAVPNGWIYRTSVTTTNGLQHKRTVFVPRAMRRVQFEYTADGTAALAVTDLPTVDIANRLDLWVGNGAHRAYVSGARTKTEHFSTTGTTQIDWHSVFMPRNGEIVNLSILKNVSE